MKLNIMKEWFERRSEIEDVHEIGAGLRTCHCIGPQNGQPLCPCAMQSVSIVDGRYVQVNDLGPAPSAPGGSRANKGEDA